MLQHGCASVALPDRGIIDVSATLQQMSSTRLDRWRTLVTAARIPTRRTSLTSPVVDYEPPPVPGLPTGPCPPPSPAALRRRTPRPLRPVPRLGAGDRRRGSAARSGRLRRRRTAPGARSDRPPKAGGATAPASGACAVRRRGRVGRPRHRSMAPPSCGGCDCGRCDVHCGEARATEVFATYSRGTRVRAIAGRVQLVNGRWVMTALQIG